MRQIMTIFAAAALAVSVAACEDEIEPGTDNAIVEAMPETPDISDTAADERIIREGGPESQAVGGQPAPTEPAPAN